LITEIRKGPPWFVLITEIRKNVPIVSVVGVG